MTYSLISTALLILSFFSQVTPTPSRLDLLRQLQAAKEQAKTAEQVVVKHNVMDKLRTAQLKPSGKPASLPVPVATRVALPALPDKPTNLTDYQNKVWDRLEELRKPLHLDPEDADTFKKAVLDLTDIMGSDIVGDDPRDAIAQRPELQQLFLHIVLHIKNLNVHPLRDGEDVKEVVSQLLNTLFDAWERMGLDKGESARQLDNLKDLHASWTDRPLSDAEQEELKHLQKAATDMGSSSISTRTKAAGALAAILGGGAIAALLRHNSKARATVGTVIKTVTHNIPEASDDDTPEEQEENTEAVVKALDKARDVINDALLTVQEEQEAEKALQAAEDDVRNQESPEVEAGKITFALFETFYANNALFPLENFKNNKYIHKTFFTTASISMPMIAQALERMNELFNKQTSKDNDDTVSDLIIREENPIIEVLNLPPSFFASAAKLPALYRYEVAHQTTTLLLKIAAALNQAGRVDQRITPIFDAFDRLAVATKEEIGLFDLLSNSFLTLLQLGNQIDSSFNPLDITTWPSLPINIAEQLEKGGSDLAYKMVITNLIKLLKTRGQMISANYRLRNIFISNTNSLVFKKEPTGLSVKAISATKHFMTAQEALAEKVQATTGTEVVTDYAWSEQDKEILSPIKNLTSLLTNLDKAFSRSGPRRILNYLKRLNDFVSKPEHQGKRNAFRHNPTLVDELMTALAIPSAFWTKAKSELDNDERYAIAKAGAELCKHLTPTITEGQDKELLTLQGIGLDESQKADFKGLQAKFDVLALAGDGEQDRYTVFKKAMNNFKEVSADFAAAYKKLVTDGPADENGAVKKGLPTKEQYDAYNKRVLSLNKSFQQIMTQIKEILNSEEERRAFHSHMMRPLLFDASSQLVITDIPEGLNKDSRELTEEVLELIMNNPKELGFAGVQEDSIVLAIRSLITDARTDDRGIISRLPSEQRTVYFEAHEAVIELGGLSTFTSGAKRIYRLLKNDESRSIVSESTLIYDMLMSEKGILGLPKEVDQDNPFAEGKLTKQDALFGTKMYEMALKHPNDLKLGDGESAEDTGLMLLALRNRKDVFANGQAANATRAGAAAAVASGGGAAITGTKTAAGAVITKAPPQVTSSDTGDQAAIQSMLNLITERNAELLNWRTCESSATLVKQALDSESEREAFGQYEKVKAHMFSSDGLLVDIDKLSDVKPLNVDSFEALFEMIEVLLDNPKELGYNDLTADPNDGNPTLYSLGESPKVITKDSIQQHLKKMKEHLEERQEVMDNKGYDEEEDPNAYNPREHGINPNNSLNDSGGLLTPEQLFGPRKTSKDLVRWNKRQRQLYNWLYDEGFGLFRDRDFSNFYRGTELLYSIVFEINLNDAIMGYTISQRIDLFHIINKPALRAIFHRAIFPDFLSDNFAMQGDKTKANPKFEHEIEKAIHMYNRMIESETDFAFDALNMKKARLMVDWLEFTTEAPTRDDIMMANFRNNPSALKNNPMAAAMMMGNKAGSGGNQLALMAAMNSGQSGGGINPATMMMLQGQKGGASNLPLLMAATQGANPGVASGGQGNDMMKTMMMMNMMKDNGGSSDGGMDPMMLMMMNGGKMDPMMMIQMQKMQQDKKLKKELEEKIAKLEEQNKAKKAAEPTAPTSEQFKQSAQSPTPQTWNQAQSVIQQDTRRISRDMEKLIEQSGDPELEEKLAQYKKVLSTMKLFEGQAIQDNVISPDEAEQLDTLEARGKQLKADIDKQLLEAATAPARKEAMRKAKTAAAFQWAANQKASPPQDTLIAREHQDIAAPQHSTQGGWFWDGQEQQSHDVAQPYEDQSTAQPAQDSQNSWFWGDQQNNNTTQSVDDGYSGDGDDQDVNAGYHEDDGYQDTESYTPGYFDRRKENKASGYIRNHADQFTSASRSWNGNSEYDNRPPESVY